MQFNRWNLTQTIGDKGLRRAERPSRPGEATQRLATAGSSYYPWGQTDRGKRWCEQAWEPRATSRRDPGRRRLLSGTGTTEETGPLEGMLPEAERKRGVNTLASAVFSVSNPFYAPPAAIFSRKPVTKGAGKCSVWGRSKE